MNYKNTIAAALSNISATNDRVRFIGYNVVSGRAGGTLNEVEESKLIEMPVAENLVFSSAIGLSIGGYIPIVYLERMDFITNALDALTNHLDKMRKISLGEFTPKVIVRVVVGNRKVPLFTGDTHIQDFSHAIRLMCPSIDVFQMKSKLQVEGTWIYAMRSNKSSIIVEYKDLYGV